jgi:hypothetical protein
MFVAIGLDWPHDCKHIADNPALRINPALIRGQSGINPARKLPNYVPIYY